MCVYLKNTLWSLAPVSGLGPFLFWPVLLSDECWSLCENNTKIFIQYSKYSLLCATSTVQVFWRSTHRTFSSDLGRTKMAMGWSWAACSLRTALAETSRMQCFPCCSSTNTGSGSGSGVRGQGQEEGQRHCVSGKQMWLMLKHSNFQRWEKVKTWLRLS